jgi:hypothetical protein
MADPRLAFIEAAAGGARKGAREFGVPASVCLAQACLESGFGKFHIGAANNYFGIKAFPRNGSVDVGRIATGFVIVPTKEVVNGRTITVNARFRKYRSMADSMRDHGSFLRVNPRYKPAFAFSRQPDRFARELQRAGYATDPQYAAKLISLMKTFDLYRFDRVRGGQSVVEPPPEQPEKPVRPVRPYIAAVQRDLNTHLKRLGSHQRLAVDGVWDEHTERALERVCRVLGIEPRKSLRTFRVIAGATGAVRTPEELERAATDGAAFEKELRARFAGDREEKRRTTPPTVVGGTPLERRARVQAYVAALQRDLNWHLERLGAPELLEVDGDWGEHTGRAFRRVCRVLGLEPKRSVRTFRVIAGTVAARTPAELERAALDGEAYRKRLEAMFDAREPAEEEDEEEDDEKGERPPGERGPRIFRIESPHMTGKDVRAFQHVVNARFERWGIDKRIDCDGEYGMLTRRAARQVAYGLGISAKEHARGVTPDLRIKVRTPSRRSAEELERARARRKWLRRLRRAHEGGGAELALAYARKHLGHRESGSNRGALVDKWNRAAGSPLGSPWCGNFMNACLMAAGFPSEPWLAACRFIEANAKAGIDGWEWTQRPVPGDLVLFTVSGAANHVGMVESVGPAQIVTIEGNTRQQGDVISNGYGVFRRQHSRAVPRGYARPPYGR